MDNCGASMSDTDKAARVWFVEKSESGTFDLTDWPSYCDEDESEIFNSLPDEVELVEKSYADALEKELFQLQSRHNLVKQCHDLAEADVEKLEDELAQAQAKIEILYDTVQNAITCPDSAGTKAWLHLGIKNYLATGAE
jgi:hypothetical protein